LKKALYGCIESAKLWYNTLSARLGGLGFIPNTKDKCVFNKQTKSGVQFTVCVYVDDLLCTCRDAKELQWLYEELKVAYGTITLHEGKIHSYLGQTFDFSEHGKVKITMEKYVADMLNVYDVRGTAATPATNDLFVIYDDGVPLSAEIKEKFHSRVAKLLFLAKRVRPDILTSIIFLSTRVNSPTEQDWSKLARVLKYINATAELGIVLEGSRGLQIFAYADASYGVHADYKSHTGALISLGGGPIWAKSSKQKLNSKSSTEAELIGVSDALSQILWTREFLQCQGYDVAPVKLYQDNTSTMALANNGCSNAERTRHIAIRFFFVKDKIEAQEVELVHLGTNEMVADLLTKPIQGEKFRYLRRLLLNWD
jgi:hypothetical protein